MSDKVLHIAKESFYKINFTEFVLNTYKIMLVGLHLLKYTHRDRQTMCRLSGTGKQCVDCHKRPKRPLLHASICTYNENERH